MIHRYDELNEKSKTEFRDRTREFPVLSTVKEIRWTSLYYTVENMLLKFKIKIIFLIMAYES